jgi:hypothetical protein
MKQYIRTIMYILAAMAAAITVIFFLNDFFDLGIPTDIDQVDARHTCQSLTDTSEVTFYKFNQTFNITLEHKGYCLRT